MNNSPVITKTGYRGGKHGYTDAAGKTLTAVFTESFRTGDRPIIYVILGTDDLESAVAVLRESVATMGIQDMPLSGILQAYE